MKTSHSRALLALLVTVGVPAAACSSFSSDPAAADAGPGEPSPRTDSGGFPPVSGQPAKDSGSDTGRDAGGDAPAGSWSPKDLPGLAVWLDATVGATFDVNTKLTSWIDQSGNGNNGTITAPCVGPARAANSLNGHDTLAFTGSASVGACVAIADATSMRFGINDFAVFVVARYSNVPNVLSSTGLPNLWTGLRQEGTSFNYTGARLFANTVSSEAKLQLWQNNSSGNGAVSATALLNDATFRRFGGTRRGVALETWIDGTADGSVTLPSVVDVTQPARAAFIGGDPVAAATGSSLTGWLLGNIAEVVAVKGNLTDAQIAQLDGHFKTKHGL